MSYLVLARKYRPQRLNELVGQQHIGRALSNAIRMDRVAHAYLFCGARGTGKTSTARIVAKMLNCETGPTVEPCGTCQACTEIAASNSIDVYELDAASNRGVAEIRELREGVGYAPARDRHKIYIVDEAHMLTTEAANAFLKTLEEPPDHAVFILATTDPQRLPVTIRSRCQRYDFRRVRAADVVVRLETICKSEGVELGREALFLVAREGDGSMRDSLSVLDQVIAFGGEAPSEAEVAALLGVADRQRTAGLIAALLQRDAVAGLTAVAAAHGHGIDLRSFARTLAMEARDLLVVRLSDATARDLVDRSDSEIEDMRQLCAGHDSAELERLAQVLLELAENVAQARHPRLVLEMGVVRLCRAARLVDVGRLASRVEALLRAPGGAGPSPTRGGGGGGGGRGGGGGGGGGRRAPARPAAPGRGPAPSGDSMPPRRRIGTTRSQRSRSTAPAAAARADEPAPAPAALAEQPASRPAEPAPIPPEPARKNRGRSLRDDDLHAWEATVRDELGDPIVGSMLARAVVAASGPGRVALAFGNAFHVTKAREPRVLELLKQGAERAFGGAYTVEIAGVQERANTHSLTALRKAADELVRRDEVHALSHDETVVAVLETFAGKLVHAVSEQELLAAGEDA